MSDSGGNHISNLPVAYVYREAGYPVTRSEILYITSNLFYIACAALASNMGKHLIRVGQGQNMGAFCSGADHGAGHSYLHLTRKGLRHIYICHYDTPSFRGNNSFALHSV